MTGDKRLVWNGLELCEERDSNNAVNIRRFYPQGEQINGQSYYYTVTTRATASAGTS